MKLASTAANTNTVSIAKRRRRCRALRVRAANHKDSAGRRARCPALDEPRNSVGSDICGEYLDDPDSTQAVGFNLEKAKRERFLAPAHPVALVAYWTVTWMIMPIAKCGVQFSSYVPDLMLPKDTV